MDHSQAEPVQFSPLDSEIAHVDVRRADASLAFVGEEVATGGPRVYLLGPTRAPRFRIEEPWSDDAWRIDVLDGGQCVRGTVTERVEWEYMQWAEGAAAENGASLLGALPEGRYLLVRSSRRPRKSSRILLGNEFVERPPNAATLLDVKRYYAAWFGPSRVRQPATVWPLVGVVVLNCTWQPGLDEVLFFDCASTLEAEDLSAKSTTTEENPVLVMPVRGPLVLHGCTYHDIEGRTEDLRRWEERDALLFARTIATYGP